MNEEFQIALSLALNESSIAKVKERLNNLKKELQTTIEVNVEVAKPKIDKIPPIEPKIEPKIEPNLIPKIEPVIEPIVDSTGIKNYTAQIEALQERINDLKATLESIDASDSASDIMWYRVELEKAQNQMADLVNKQKNLGKETKKLSFQHVVDAIKSATKNAKIFTMALIGARSIYFGIRKAMNAFLSQNEELQNKLNACYYALGSLFAPILEYIVNLFVKLIGYVNVFLRALGFAGINMSKFGKKASSSAKSTKEINKSLSGFDELNNIGGNEPQGGGGGAGGVENPFENQDLDLTWIDRITQFGEWCKANIPLISGLLLGVASGIIAIKLGCDGIKALGIGLIVGGIAMSIMSLIEYLKDPTWSSFGGIIQGIGIAILGLALIIGSVPLAVAGVIVLVAGLLASHWEEVKAFLQNIEDGIGNAITNCRTWLTENLGIIGTVIDIFVATALGFVQGLVEGIKDFLDNLFLGIKQIIDGIIMICNGDLKGGLSLILQGLWSIIKGLVLLVWDIIKDTLKGIIGSLANFGKTAWTKITGFFSKVVNGFGQFWQQMSDKAKTWVKNIINKYIISPINKVISWINSKLHFSYSGLRVLGKEIVPSFSVQLAHLNSLPQLNVGTNYVPNDMVAQLHQGEAVVPKKFNSKEYFTNNNDETNALLEKLINRVENLEMNPYVTVKDVGKASVKYINSQKRIKGVEVI